MKKAVKRTSRKATRRRRSLRDTNAGDSPEAVLATIDAFVATRESAYQQLSARLQKAKRITPAQHATLVAVMRQLSEARKLRARVAKVVADVTQRLRLIENSARIAIATAFADYQQRVSRGRP